MADIAQLGIQAKTTGVKESASDLNQLTGAAARAEAAVEGFGAANQGAAGAASAAAVAFAKEGAAVQAASRQMGLIGVAANQNVAGTRNFANESKMLAMQLSQVAQQTQATGNFMQALAIQIPDIGMGFGTIGIAVGVLLGIILPLIPAGKMAASALVELADVLPTIAPYAVAAAAGLALLYSPAIIGGIVSLIALMGRLVTQVFAVAAAFALANPGAAFVLGLVAVVAAMNIFRDELKQIFGRDIVGDVKSAANFIIGAFVGAFQGIKAAWSALPAALGDIVYQTVNVTIAGVQSMINKVISMINAFIGGVYDSLSGLGAKVGIDIGTYKGIGDVNLGTVTNPYTGAASKAMSAVSTAMTDAQKTDYVGKTYEVIGNAASKAADKLRQLATGLTKVDEAKKKSASSGKTDQEKYQDIVDGANRSLSTLKAEQAAVGLSAEAAAKLKYETELLNKAQQANITLTAAQKAQLSNLAGQMASVETATADAKANLELAKSSATGFLSTLRQGLVAGEGWWTSFGNAALSVLDKIASAIETKLVDALLSSTSGGFNLLSLFGLGGSVVSGGLSGGAAGATAAASAPAAKMAAARLPAAKSAASVQGGGVHVTVGLVKNGLNIEPEVVEVSRTEAARAAGAVKTTFEGWRRTGFHNDVESHLKNRRKTG